MKVLFYIDSVVAYGNSVIAAEMLRRELDAQIVVMCVDSQKYLNAGTKAYEIYDYANLVSLGTEFVRVWPKEGGSPGRHAPSKFVVALRAVWNAVRRNRRRTIELRRWMFDETPERIAILSRQAAARLLPHMPRLQALVVVAFQAAFLPLVLICRLVDAVLGNLNLRLCSGLRWAMALTVGRDSGSAEAASQEAVEPAKARRWKNPISGVRPMLRLLVAYQTIRRFLQVVEPDLIVLVEENVETLSSVFVAQGRRRNIPTIILPFTLPNPLEPAQFYKGSVDHQAGGPLAGILCWFWPKWRFTYDGRDLIRLPAPLALLAECLGASSPDPWVLNRGQAAAVALDSLAQRDQYLHMGFPPSQLRVVGDAHGDTLFDAISNRPNLLASLYAAHGFAPGKPLVLCGFPPDQFNSYDSAGFEFSDYHSLVSAWACVFRELKAYAHVLVRPHPRASAAQIELLRSHGLEVSLQPTAELIPLCDIYVASISATIRWAITCGIPVVNYDTYRYRYGDFSSAAGVVHVERIDDFREVLFRILTDGMFAADLRSTQSASMEYWGFCDGKTSDRLAAVANEVVAASRRLSGL